MGRSLTAARRQPAIRRHLCERPPPQEPLGDRGAQELQAKGIWVSALSPGATETPIIRGQFDSHEASDTAKEMFASMTPLGRLGRPEKLAAFAYFPAPDDSSYVTGINVPVYGGLAQV